MKNLNSFLIFLLIGIVLNGCRKDEDSSPDSMGLTGNQITASFSGMVRDLQGNPMSGVLVSIGGNTTVTNGSGIYTFQSISVSSGRVVIEAEKAGFWNQQKGILATTNAIEYSEIVLFPDDKSYTVDATSGGTVNLNGGSAITFPANAFEKSNGSAYTGQVFITAHDIQTTNQNYRTRVPGGDMLAVDNAGNQTMLLSYGMVGAKLYDAAGAELFLKQGIKATIKMSINPSQMATAPANIPLWHYDENLMKWKEEGMANKTGSYYEGEVSHFSWWNLDVPCLYTHLSMSMIDCNNLPLSNGRIYLTAANYGTGASYTNSMGIASGYVYSGLPLVADFFHPSNISNIPDTSFIIGPFSSGASIVIPPIFLGANCRVISGSLVDCANNPINGTVALLLNNQPAGFVTTTNGNFQFQYTQTGTYLFLATVGQLTGADSIVIDSTNFGQSFNITLALCDTIQTANTNFTMNFVSGSTHLQYSLNVTDVDYAVTSGGQEQIIFSYQDSATLSTSQIVLDIPSYSVGNFPWNFTNCNVHGNLVYAGQIATITSNSGFTKLYSAPSPGGILMGVFNGQVLLQVGPVSVPGNLSASFNVWRNQ